MDLESKEFFVMSTVQEAARFLKLDLNNQEIIYRTIRSSDEGTYHRHLVEYDDGEGATVPAFILEPKGPGPFPAILIHHQHNGERHFGKSEVYGLVGDPLQAFGPALVEKGFLVLAPDSICFEDRRKNKQGVEADSEEADWLQHFNEMTYRLVKGDTLMRKVLQDANLALSLLSHHPKVIRKQIGVLGHSYGGNTVLFQMALDPRIAFGCSSGAACTYANKIQNQTGFEMALAIPGFTEKWEITDLVKSICPRKLLLVSAEDDKYSKDADRIFVEALPVFNSAGVASSLVSQRYKGAHALTSERFEFIIDWLSKAL